MTGSRSLRVFVVEDERPARDALIRMLARTADVDVVGHAGDVDTAVHGIGTLRPEAVFLDVQLPMGSGFRVLEELDYAPRVVFTTAFEAHAIAAFDIAAVDYLLKPFAQERLELAVARARGVVPAAPLDGDAANASEADSSTTITLERVYIRRGRRIVVVPLADVLRIEAEGMYVKFITERGTYVASVPISELSQRLPTTTFLRVHRGHIVNLNAVTAFTVLPSGRMQVDLRNGAMVPCSREYARGIREAAW